MFLKVMCPYFGGTMQESKQVYQAAFDWFDALADKAACPECLAIFVRPGELRSLGEEYLQSPGTPLHSWWPLFKELLVASAALCSERRLEGNTQSLQEWGSKA